MKNRILRKMVFALMPVFLIAGCGRVSISNGDRENDPSILSVGCFEASNAAIDFPSSDISIKASFASDAEYKYIFSNNDSFNSGCDLYYISSGISGNDTSYDVLDLPVSYSDSALNLSDLCKPLFDDDSFTSQYSSGSASYSNFVFDKSGAFSAYCNFFALESVDATGAEHYISKDIFVKWDNTGKCISVESVDEIPSDYSDLNNYVSFDGELFSLVESGIAKLGDDGSYLSSYFDCFNSGFDASGFVGFSVLDDDHFSGICKNNDGVYGLYTFTRKTVSPDKIPVLLACTSVDDDLKDKVLAYNNNNSGYKIVVYDYLDRTLSGSESESWSLLKEDLIGGFEPDIVINGAGYDPYTESVLSEGAKLYNFGKVIKKDKDLKGLEFTENAEKYFYSGTNGQVYSLIPGYSFRTIAGNDFSFSEAENWGIDTYLSFAESLAGERTIFYLDTSDDFIKRFVEYNGNAFVDFPSGESSFDSGQYVSVLEYAKTLPSDYSEASDLMFSSSNLGGYLLTDIACGNLGDIHLTSTRNAKGDYVFVGFPCGSDDGSGVIRAASSMMVFSSSAHVDECWNFLKTYLSSDYQENLKDDIPVTVSGYDKWLENRQANVDSADSYVYFSNGEEKVVFDPDDEQVSYIVDHISDCKRLEFSDYRIEQIVLSNAQDFFDGKVTAQEAAQATEREVEEYLKGMG